MTPASDVILDEALEKQSEGTLGVAALEASLP